MDAEEWDRRYEASELVWTAGPNQFVAEQLADLPPGRALDLAAGEGRNAIWLAEQGWRVTAVDFSRVALDKGARLAAQRGVELDWVVADVLRYQPEAGGYDLVLLSYLQLPADQMATVLHTSAGALAPGGTLLVVGHDLINLTEGVGGPQDPDVLYTPETVCAQLPGLRITRAERVRRQVRTADGERSAVDALVLATLQ
jgi:2-polyprenyl-3-methyl-5-hydroxy-6-metoxy-1,4-benzoquinol methylase